MALAVAGVVVVSGDTQQERELKVAFLFNFAKFIQWPPDVIQSRGPIIACVLGNVAIGESFERVTKGRTIDGHDLVVSTVTVDGPLRACHLLYVSHPDSRSARLIIETLKGSAVLTVSDFEAFAILGGVMNFFIENGQTRFAINVDAASRARLQISSKLLALAAIVRDQP